MLRRKLKRPLLVLALIVLVYIVIKGVMYLRVKNTMDDFIAEAAGQAEIHYGGIETELRGSARVYDIEVRPRDFTQSIKIAGVRISTDDPWMLIGGGDWQSGDAPPPEHMGLSIEGVSVSLDEEMLAALAEQAKEQARMSGQKLASSACDGSMNLDPDLLVDMGFTEVVMDVDAEYRFDTINEQLSAEMNVEIRDIESVEMSVELDGVIPDDVGAGAVSTLALRSAAMQMTIKPEFGNEALKVCAERKQLNVVKFREQLIKRAADELNASGVKLGESLLAAMASYYQDWGELRVDVRPDKPLGMLALMMTKPENMGSMLGINLYVNDKRIENPEFSFALPTFVNDDNERDDIFIPTLPTPKRVRVTRRYEKVSAQLLDQYIGVNVKIQPVGQPLRVGKLTAITGGEAAVVQRAHGGSVTSYVRLDQIESLEVERIERETLD